MAPSVKVRLEVEGAPEAIAAVRAFTQQSKTAGNEAASGFGAAGGALGKLPGVLKGVGIAFTALKLAQLVGEVKDFTLETVRLAAEQKDLALQVGTTVRNMSALSAVAKVTNTDQGKLTKGFGDLADRIKDLRAGVPSAVKSFQQLGLRAKDFASDDVIENAAKVAEALEKVARGGTRGALATDVLGKSGRALLPVFEKLNELGGLEGATAFAEKLGVLVTPKTVATFEAIASEMAKMNLTARGLALSFAEALGPDLIVVLREIQQLFFDATPAAEVFGRVIGALVRVVGALVINVAALGTVLARVATGQFGKIAGDIERFDQALLRLATDRPKIEGFDDSVGAAAPAIDEAALKRKLELVEKYNRAELEAMQATDARSEAFDRIAFEKGELSLVEYFKRRLEILDRSFAAEQVLLEQRQKGRDPEGMEFQTIAAEITALRAKWLQGREGLAAELAALQAKVKTFGTELRTSLTEALTQFATHGIQQVKSLTDAFRELGLVIANAVARVAGTYLVQSLPFLKAAPGKAAGGLLRGPGTGTSDSIPAWVSTGEYVVPAARVAIPGVLPMLEALRSGGLEGALPAIQRALAVQLRPSRYAEGGMVGDAQPGVMLAGGGAAATIGGQVTIGLDDGVVLKALQSPAGQRALLKIVSRNPRAFGAALGR